MAATVAAPAVPPQSAPFPAVLTISGPAWQSKLAAGGQVWLSRPEVHIGQLGTNDVILRDPLASRLHSVIRWSPNGYVLQDSGSTSGTFVEGQHIEGPILLVPGQRIQIGGTQLLFQAVAGYSQAGPAPVPSASTAVVATAPGMSRQARFRRWLERQKPKYYWRVFVFGLVSYIVATIVLNATDNAHMVPLSLILGAALVPVTFVVFCWEEGAFADIPATVVGLSFVGGAVLGLILAAGLEPILVVGTGFGAALVVGLCEETSKGVVGAWFLRDKRLNSELDGLIVGAAVGMGFATMETAGYGFSLFLDGFINYVSAAHTIHDSFVHGLASMESVIALRMVLAIFGHGTWTAIICAALWRERGNSIFRLTRGVALAYGISVFLHALWDTNSSWIPFVAVVGILILRFFIKESLERARLGPLAPPPPPLGHALGSYFRHLLHFRTRIIQQPAGLVAALSTAVPIGAPGSAQAQPAMPAPPPTVPRPVQATPAAPPQMVRCPRCSTENAAGSHFCSSCGSQLPGNP